LQIEGTVFAKFLGGKLGDHTVDGFMGFGVGLQGAHQGVEESLEPLLDPDLGLAAARAERSLWSVRRGRASIRRRRPRGTPEKWPMRDTSKAANGIRQDKVVITHCCA